MAKKDFVGGLSKILKEKELLSPEDEKLLDKSFSQHSKESFDYFLLNEGIIGKDDLLEALSEYYQVPAFDVTGYFFNQDTLHFFPKDFLLRNAIIPLERDENMLIMIASEPDNPELLPKIGNFVSYDIRFQVGIRQDILDAVQEYYDDSVTRETVSDVLSDEG